MPRKYIAVGKEWFQCQRRFNEAGADAPEILFHYLPFACATAGFNEAGADAPEIPELDRSYGRVSLRFNEAGADAPEIHVVFQNRQNHRVRLQ